MPSVSAVYGELALPCISQFGHLEKLDKEQFVEVRGTIYEGRIYKFRGLCPPNIRTRACAGGIWEPGGVSPRSAMENILEPAQGAGGINGGSDIMR